MALNLQKMKESLQKEEQKAQNTGGGDNAVYPFWNIPEDTPAVLRFLPDGDEDNDTSFWKERNIINLEFNGVKGGKSEPVKVVVPCMEMFGENCPVLTEARRFYKEGKDSLGQQYWKKRSYVFQGFVRTNPLKDDTPPENPVRRFMIGPMIFKTIKNQLMSFAEDDENPVDFQEGYDFRILRTQGAKGSDYTGSNWARKSSPLSQDELDALEKYGLFNLSDFLPKKPDAESLRVITEMFEASLDGDPYDLERFGNYYKPYGLDFNNNSDNSSSSSNTSSKSEDTNKDSGESSKSETKATNAQELLSRLKQNKKS